MVFNITMKSEDDISEVLSSITGATDKEGVFSYFPKLCKTILTLKVLFLPCLAMIYSWKMLLTNQAVHTV